MSPVVRPVYKEGQVLGAADLNAQLTYERLGSVLHERTEHLWGVAQGLTLSPIERQATDPAKTKYVDVNLMPGRAVDRLGRSLVVSDAIPLETQAFKLQVAKPLPGSLYPVFVQAIEVPRQGETSPGKCNVALTTRIEEGLQVSFGSPGEELAVLDQTAATVDEGFGTPSLSDKVLVGWVKFNPLINKFSALATEGNGVRIRYVGVVASDVVAGGGALTLHSRPEGARFALSIVEDSTGGCLLKFGKQDGNGPIVETFTVDESGNVNYKGALTPAPVAKTLAESGVAFDGITLPLPPNVTPEQVNQATVRLHISVTPWPHAMRTFGGANIIPIVETCHVDSKRRVSCKVRWLNLTTGTSIIQPSACTYMLVASGT